MSADRKFEKSVNVGGLGKMELVRGSYCNFEFPKHMHADYSFVVIRKGAHELGLKKSNELIHFDRVVTLNPETVHTGKSVDSSGWEHNIFFVPEKMMVEFAAETGIKARPPRFKDGSFENPYLADTLRKSFDNLAADKGDLASESLVIHTLGKLFEQNGLMVFDENKQAQARGIGRAIEFLKENFTDKIDLMQLAEIANMSRFHFLRLFSRETGLTPNAYRTQLRINKGINMLKNGSTIVEAAYECGFSDQSHFTKTFKSLYGTPPSSYI